MSDKLAADIVIKYLIRILQKCQGCEKEMRMGLGSLHIKWQLKKCHTVPWIRSRKGKKTSVEHSEMGPSSIALSVSL